MLQVWMLFRIFRSLISTTCITPLVSRIFSKAMAVTFFLMSLLSISSFSLSTFQEREDHLISPQIVAFNFCEWGDFDDNISAVDFLLLSRSELHRSRCNPCRCNLLPVLLPVEQNTSFPFSTRRLTASGVSATLFSSSLISLGIPIDI